jgi:outer membrane protein OmpA-like peptidoglycan-associated protein
MFDDEDREAGIAVFVAVTLAVLTAAFAAAVAIATVIGVPQEATPARASSRVVLAFPADAAELPADALTRIAPLLRALREVPGASVVIAADGAPELAARRAAAVAELLVDAGVARDRITTVAPPMGAARHDVTVEVQS